MTSLERFSKLIGENTASSSVEMQTMQVALEHEDDFVNLIHRIGVSSFLQLSANLQREAILSFHEIQDITNNLASTLHGQSKTTLFQWFLTLPENVRSIAYTNPEAFARCVDDVDIEKISTFNTDDVLNALQKGASYNYLDMIAALINAYDKINTTDCDGNTPLHLAVINYLSSYDSKSESESKLLDILKCLLKNGADINTPNNKQITPLHSAASLGSLVTVRFLVENGARVNVENHLQNTPLHLALQSHNITDPFARLAIAEFLLANGTPVNAKNRREKTPLHLILEQAVAFFTTQKDLFLSVTKYFVNSGADVNAMDENGNTPLNLALHYRLNQLAIFLFQHGAEVDSTALRDILNCHFDLETTKQMIHKIVDSTQDVQDLQDLFQPS